MFCVVPLTVLFIVKKRGKHYSRLAETVLEVKTEQMEDEVDRGNASVLGD